MTVQLFALTWVAVLFPVLALTQPAKKCGECHVEIYEQWKTSLHARAYVDTLFRQKSGNYTKTECLPCHAPEPVLETGLHNPPVLRTVNPEEGVTCVSCHKMGARIMGPFSGLKGECNPSFSVEFKKSEICASCHTEHYKEFCKTHMSDRDTTCNTCHMEPDQGRLVADGPVRRIGLHKWSGGHSPLFLEALVKDIQFDMKGDTLIVIYKNDKIGHCFPSGTAARPAVIFIAMLVRLNGNAEKVFRREFIKTRKEGEKVLQPREKLVLKYPVNAKEGKITFVILYKNDFSLPDNEGTIISSKTITFKNE